MTIRIIALYTSEHHKDIHVVYSAKGVLKSAHYTYEGFLSGEPTFYYQNLISDWDDIATNYDDALLRKSDQYLLGLTKSLTTLNR